MGKSWVAVDTKLSFGWEKDNRWKHSIAGPPQHECHGPIALPASCWEYTSLPGLGKFPTLSNTSSVFKANATENGCHKRLTLNGYWCLKHSSSSLCSWKSCNFLETAPPSEQEHRVLGGPFCIVVLFYTAPLVMEIITSAVMKGKPGSFLSQVSSVSPLGYNT